MTTKASAPQIGQKAWGTLFYFYEISSRIDCGSTLQIANDYGQLSKEGCQTELTIINNNSADRHQLEDYMQTQRESLLSINHVKRRHKYADRALLVLNFMHWIRKTHPTERICIIREDKHLGLIRALRLIFRFKLISEIHEGGLPNASRSRTKEKYQRFLNTIDGLVLTSIAQKQHIESEALSMPNNIVLNNGVEIVEFAQAKKKIKGDKIITYTGMFSPWKNIPLLFKSLRLLPNEFKLRIAGGKKGCTKSATYIQDLCSEHQVEARVDFRGFINRHDLVAQVLNESSVLAVPLDKSYTAMYGTSPMKLMEYLATNIPIVAINLPSITSIVSSREAILCEPDPQSFAAAINQACNTNTAGQVLLANKLAESYSHKSRAKKYSIWLRTNILNQISQDCLQKCTL